MQTQQLGKQPIPQQYTNNKDIYYNICNILCWQVRDTHLNVTR